MSGVRIGARIKQDILAVRYIVITDVATYTEITNMYVQQC